MIHRICLFWKIGVEYAATDTKNGFFNLQHRFLVHETWVSFTYDILYDTQDSWRVCLAGSAWNVQLSTQRVVTFTYGIGLSYF